MWNALTPLPEGTTSIETVFRLMDIPFPSPLATEVYRRLCVIGSTMQAHSEQRQAQHQTTRTPGQPVTEDLLAGLVEDDDED